MMRNLCLELLKLIEMQRRCEVWSMHVYLSVRTGMRVFGYINIHTVFPLSGISSFTPSLFFTDTQPLFSLRLSSHFAYLHKSEEK